MNVGIRELRDGLSRYVAAARDGEEIVVTDHGRAVARLVPYRAPSVLESLIARGLVTPAAQSRTELPEPIVAQGTVSDLIAQQRR
ncbi:type II toxin-antitoxin system Phd/YefM family antitoxin [Microbacterium luticocti]|uniref:type II toxin-antitoxin system Phd/YefM family antitoxin n=1 Tax=Microbacterium luticocti TaxID=451764 RepID=UPI00040B8DAC|nr:type II toxin-antitoxin system prevent-host-death family antitoxin [Microbacterium luticocti]